MRKAALAAHRARAGHAAHAVAGPHARGLIAARRLRGDRARTLQQWACGSGYTLLYASGFQVKAQKYCAARAENIGTSESSMPR